MTQTAIRSQRVYLPTGLQPATIVFENGIVTNVVTDHAPSAKSIECEIRDYGDHVIMPGLVDTHVHINEPGRTDWEGFETATRAAAAGGITTLTDMPLNCIPVTTSKSALDEKLKAVAGKLFVDCSYWGGAVPGNQDEVEPMLKAGVRGFKAFMIDSGIDEFQFSKKSDLEKVLPILAREKKPLIVHAELESPVEIDESAHESYDEFLKSRPKSWENEAILQLIELSEKHQAHIHVVHLSSAEALESITAAKAKGIRITAETCPHYLNFTAEEIPDGDGRYKCCPPVREKENREHLWKGLASGTIDMIVSDHSPCHPKLKNLETKNLKDAWGGISALQFGLSVIWTQARSRGFSFSDLSRWMSERTAKLVGLENKKGKIAPGLDADFVIWNPEEESTIEKAAIQHKHQETPYEGKEFYGVVIETILRGQTIFKNGRCIDEFIGESICQTK